MVRWACSKIVPSRLRLQAGRDKVRHFVNSGALDRDDYSLGTSDNSPLFPFERI